MRHLISKKKVWILAILCVGLLGVGFVSVNDKYFKIAQQLEIFSQVYKEINKVYADEVDPTRLMKSAIDSMMQRLDPYTVFISESRIEEAKVIRTGQYSGIGMDIARRDGQVVVRSIVEKGPANQKGIAVGDIIHQIDAESLTDTSRSMAQIENLILGEQGSSVLLQLQRDTVTWQLEVERDYVEELQSSVPYYGFTDDSIGYVKLTVFNESSGRDLENAVKDLKEKHPTMEGVIIDIRDNLGGRVDQAIHILNLFLPKNEKVLDMRGQSEMHTRKFLTQLEPWDTEIPLAILINSNSASASEIVSGAIQDLDRGIIVGSKSFGKGLVQNIRPLSYNTQFKITVAKYYTPSGRCIQAIDYSSRTDEGTVKEVPDSIKRDFKTQNGRDVFEGAGIDPDIEVPAPLKPAVLKALENQFIIFDFASAYVREHDSIAPPTQFVISDEMYEDFVSFAQSQNFTFSTRSEKELEKFEDLVADVDDRQLLLSQVESIEKKIVSDKKTAFEEHRSIIEATLKDELLRRYYYDSGVTEASFASDPVVLKASDYLLDKNKYQGELNSK